MIATPASTATISIVIGSASGRTHSAGMMSSRQNTLPNRTPNTIAMRPPGISIRVSGTRRPSTRPAMKTTAPCPTSPNMKPKINEAMTARNWLGSLSYRPGVPSMRANTSKARAQPGLLSTSGGVIPAGASEKRRM